MFTKRFSLLLLFIICITLSGCKNFLDGQQALKDLNDTIEYVNAKSFNAIIESDSDFGKFSDFGKKTGKGFR